MHSPDVDMFCKEGYEWLIRKGIREGFRFAPLDGVPVSGRVIYLRHDIDFSLECALDIARRNARLGIVSSFFVMLSNPFYNLFEAKSRLMLEELHKLGHFVSLHYDETQHIDKRRGLETELEVFRRLVGYKPVLISLHRPSKDFLESRWTKEMGVRTTYDNEFIEDIRYISDSARKLDTSQTIQELEKRGGDTKIQLLLHPLWWTSKERVDVNGKIDLIISKKQEKLQKWSRVNCRSYRRGD